MPTVAQLQNALGALVVVGLVSGVLYAVAVTVDRLITYGRAGRGVAR